MIERKKLRETPSQTAGPFLHIGCTPSITGINIFKDELGITPFKNITPDEIDKASSKFEESFKNFHETVYKMPN